MELALVDVLLLVFGIFKLKAGAGAGAGAATLIVSFP